MSWFKRKRPPVDKPKVYYCVFCSKPGDGDETVAHQHVCPVGIADREEMEAKWAREAELRQIRLLDEHSRRMWELAP